jgi:hypothetical protein
MAGIGLAPTKSSMVLKPAFIKKREGQRPSLLMVFD